MGRRTARESAFKAVFQASFHEPSEYERILELYLENSNIPKTDREYLLSTAKGVFGNISEIDGIIEKNLRNWDKNRINRVDLAILRVAVYEYLISKEVPGKVAINEAVELAKSYGTDESAPFVNGVLSAAYRQATDASNKESNKESNDE